MLKDGFFALLVTLLAAPIVLACLRRMQVLDMPGHRSSHELPTPRGGGIAAAVGATAALAWADGFDRPGRIGLATGVVAFALVGLVEDLVGISPFRRLILQVVAAGAALPWLLDSLDGAVAWRVLFGLGVVLWLVGYVNAFNFMDGINGISAVQAVVAGAVWYLVGRSEGVGSLATGGVIVAGAALAFAPFNFPRARVFLGDVGSYFIGAWLAAVAVLGIRGGVPPEAVLAPLALYGLDTLTTLVRRVVRHEVWYLPHRDHAYQRLVRGGWSHERTTLVVGAAVAVSGALGSVSLTGSLPGRIAADVALLTLLVAYALSPTWLAGRGGSHRRQPAPG